MVYCTQTPVREHLPNRRLLMETTPVEQCLTTPPVTCMADGGVEVFARDGRIMVVIHSGRYQITIEVG